MFCVLRRFTLICLILVIKMTSSPLYSKNIKTLVFSRGGLRGGPKIAGALWTLTEKFPIFDITSHLRIITEVRGTSIGSVAAVYVACRVKMETFVYDTLNSSNADLVEWSALHLVTSFGLNDGKKIVEHFNDFIF